jgi:hypothetical protein
MNLDRDSRTARRYGVFCRLRLEDHICWVRDAVVIGSEFAGLVRQQVSVKLEKTGKSLPLTYAAKTLQCHSDLHQVEMKLIHGLR